MQDNRTIKNQKKNFNKVGSITFLRPLSNEYRDWSNFYVMKSYYHFKSQYTYITKVRFKFYEMLVCTG